MEQVEILNPCRICDKKTKHFIRVVSDLLPPNIHVLECGQCGVMGISLVDINSDTPGTRVMP